MGDDRTTDPLATTFRKVTWRFVPFLFVCYVFNYLDRVNVGFAKLRMLGDLGMSEAAYGFGAGIFFLGYVACGVPSNLIAERIGARRWLAIIMVVWGAISGAMLLVRTPAAFFALRFAMGAAEAGFFPGIVLFLSRWFPSARRGRTMALFMSAIPLSGVLGGPLSGWILAHFAAGQSGLAAWQWLFLLESLPTILLGIALLRVLDDGGDRAAWLDPGEREALRLVLAADERTRPIAAVRSSPFTSAALIGWLSAIPYLAAVLFMLAVARSADRRGERRWHLAAPMLVGAGGLALSILLAAHPVWSLAGLTLAAMGVLTGLPMFWPLGDRSLSAGTAAAAIAFINSLGQVAGFLSPYLVGWIKDATGTTDAALALLAMLLVIGSVLVLVASRSAIVERR